jgi:hypothetical protein
MKSYPSIIRVDPNIGFDLDLYTFDKLDGSCIRAEWSRKTGWFKFGTRKRLIDKNDPIFGPAIPLFMETLAEPIAEIASNNKWVNIVAFAEFWGKSSLAGRHQPEDEKRLTLFDVSIYRHGLLGPKEFLKHFKYLNIPNFIGIKRWNRSFVDSVRNSTLDGITLEGVVGKSGDYDKLTLMKCKTNNWLNAIKQLYSEEEAQKLINS